jgi:hypothetical protein
MPDRDVLLASLPLVVVLAPAIVVPCLVALVDFVTPWRANQIIKQEGRRPPAGPRTDIATAFEILVPIFGDISYLKNVEFLAGYGERVILCTTDRESPEFERAITRVALRHGFRVFRSPVAISAVAEKPNPWRLFSRTLTHLNDSARDEIIRDSFVAVTAPVCVFLDGDTVAERPLRELVEQFVAQDLQLASVRVLASRRKTLAECLQAIEYDISMDARRVYPWLTSGACMVARTDAMREIMSTHSLFFSGGDIEIGKLAKLLRMRVGHVPFDLLTDVPETFRAWFKQRMAWFGGGFRHAIVNVNTFTWRSPFFFIYNTVIVYAMMPMRWYEVVRMPWVLALVTLIYIALLLATRRDENPFHLVLFPFYALTQVMLIVPCGIYTYFKMALRAKNVGLIRLREEALEPVIDVATVIPLGARSDLPAVEHEPRHRERALEGGR